MYVMWRDAVKGTCVNIVIGLLHYKNIPCIFEVVKFENFQKKIFDILFLLKT